jgi:hypothetical protein
MEQAQYTGKISFINHEKQFATIDYAHNNKQKAVNFKIAAAKGKKPHQYRLGDVVRFSLRLSDRGDKMTADNVHYVHNPDLELLLQRAANENRFSGYLKLVGGTYFVKEVDTYILFPLRLSPWELPPADTAENVAITFRLTDTDRPNSVRAELFSHRFIPEYRMAERHFKDKTPVDAWVSRVSPHAVYLELFTESMQAKLPVKEGTDPGLKQGDNVQVRITWLSPEKIAVERV